MRRQTLATAIAASTVVHTIGLAVLAAWSANSTGSHVQFAGREQVIQLTAFIAEPQWSLEPVTLDIPYTDPPVIIEPTEARIAKRRYLHTPTAQLLVSDLAVEFASELMPRSRKRATHDEVVDDLWEATPRSESLQPRRPATRSTPALAAVVPPASPGNTESTPPNLSQNTPPTYPALAIRRGWEGTVLLRLSIDDEGRITKVEVARSSGYPILDGAAATAVRQWTATPAHRGGKPVATVEVLPIRFRL